MKRKRRISGIRKFGWTVVDRIIWLMPLGTIVVAGCYATFE